MSNIFLTSSIQSVAGSVVEHIKKPAKLASIMTASEVTKGPKDWLVADRQSLVDAGIEVEDYTFTGKTKDEIKEYLSQFDGIAMMGGNTFYLLQQIQQAGCAEVITNFVKAGKIYIGSSAGSIIAGPDIAPVRRLDRLKEAPKIKGFKGLGLVDFVILPHWGSGDFKDKYLERMEQNYNLDHKLILLTDSQYLLLAPPNYRIIDITKRSIAN